jgi:hypothetical protein
MERDVVAAGYEAGLAATTDSSDGHAMRVI